ncbi:DUF3558 domain-containing protein [Streptomyces sp. DH24]|uniref:DUF3558 domain-containing protein n=1 Tax=Streptomyces sp. DH24 TaxID=3040123 RepID=UPI002441266B|nr:DUF3558 domain-containing protein [Streptomyces sp. DH24]MDG9718878.1 DUF3558 domain-containing protein [Streptomyces sp. DH24]
MQRKAYVPGVAALLAALLAACTGGSGDGATSDGSNPGGPGTASAPAEPGKYRTLPEPCGAVGRDTLNSLLPGIRQIADEEQREKAYAGEPTLTYDTDRKVGCRWKVESTDATDHLLVDFERVVSYDNAVSDDSRAEALFAGRREAADLPEPTATESVTESPTETAGEGTDEGTTGGKSPSASASPSGSASPSASPSDLQPRVLEDLGDDAFLDDALSSSGSTAEQRTVTVAFRTSNVIVTIEYTEQPANVGVVPDSEEMQDRARNLAAQLDDSLSD